ncbi:receptor, partial [Dermatophagoides pteronyssinus]
LSTISATTTTTIPTTTTTTTTNDTIEQTIVILEPDLRIHYPGLAILLGIICIIVVFGNGLTMLSICKERYLRTVTNYFVASLAFADCLVGSIVMPFSVVHEVMNKWWIFGQDWCDLWHSFDVLASSASILNLCVISLDRYWAITDPITYPSRMTPRKAFIFILSLWLCSALISFPAIVWWRAVAKQPIEPYRCNFTDDVGYLVFSSIISFYGPLTIMVFTYYRIYVVACEQNRSLKSGVKQIEMSCIGFGGGGGGHFNEQQIHSMNKNAKNSSQTSKRKAAKTLGIVMGVFILCWLPFFVTNILMGICPNICIMKPDLVFSIVTWLGWLNSAMNPIIYACWSKDFRRAFRKLLCSCFLMNYNNNNNNTTLSYNRNRIYKAHHHHHHNNHNHFNYYQSNQNTTVDDNNRLNNNNFLINKSTTRLNNRKDFFGEHDNVLNKIILNNNNSDNDKRIIKKRRKSSSSPQSSISSEPPPTASLSVKSTFKNKDNVDDDTN